MKRAADLVVALAFLIILSPVMVLAAIGVSLSSKGPIFFHAVRVGKGGAPFKMLKFRTMNVHSSGSVITANGDIRIFAFGSFLRKYKIDEFPQFYNVLKGNLSLVGPRPEDPKIVDLHYSDWMSETLNVRPGLTSPGSLHYYILSEKLINPADPERFYVERLLPAKLAVDRAYLERSNFISDFKVLWLTALAILGPLFGVHVKLDARDLAAAARWAPDSFKAQE